MWGHWILWNRGELSDASQHFSSALSSGRQRDFARHLQLAALIDCRSDACGEEIFHVTNDIRKEHGAVDPGEANRIFSNYYGQPLLLITASNPSVNVNAISASEYLKTFRWLFDGLDFDDSKSLLRTYDLAVLQETTGQKVEALANYRLVRSKKPASGGSLFGAADKGVNRLSPAL